MQDRARNSWPRFMINIFPLHDSLYPSIFSSIFGWGLLVVPRLPLDSVSPVCSSPPFFGTRFYSFFFHWQNIPLDAAAVFASARRPSRHFNLFPFSSPQFLPPFFSTWELFPPLVRVTSGLIKLGRCLQPPSFIEIFYDIAHVLSLPFPVDLSLCFDQIVFLFLLLDWEAEDDLAALYPHPN